MKLVQKLTTDIETEFSQLRYLMQDVSFCIRKLSIENDILI